MQSDWPCGFSACGTLLRSFADFDQHRGNAGEILLPICYQSHSANKKGLTVNRRKSFRSKVPEEGLEPTLPLRELDFESRRPHATVRKSCSVPEGRTCHILRAGRGPSDFLRAVPPPSAPCQAAIRNDLPENNLAGGIWHAACEAESYGASSERLAWYVGARQALAKVVSWASLLAAGDDASRARASLMFRKNPVYHKGA